MKTITTLEEPKLSYADALREARNWVVPHGVQLDLAPIDKLFIGWYALNARRYTLASAELYYHFGITTDLVLRPEERDV